MIGYEWGNVCYIVNFPTGEYLLYSKVSGGKVYYIVNIPGEGLLCGRFTIRHRNEPCVLNQISTFLLLSLCHCLSWWILWVGIPLTGLTPPHCLCMSQAMNCISYHMLWSLFMLNDLRWPVIVCFVDFGAIVDSRFNPHSSKTLTLFIIEINSSYKVVPSTLRTWRRILGDTN